jgi:hypothetical protein
MKTWQLSNTAVFAAIFDKRLKCLFIPCVIIALAGNLSVWIIVGEEEDCSNIFMNSNHGNM